MLVVHSIRAIPRLRIVCLAGFLAAVALLVGGRAHASSGIPQRAVKHARVLREEHRVVSVALHQLGVPYAWGGASRRGFDCSGLVRYVYAHIGISLPHYTYSQFHYGVGVARRHLKPGDLLFFNGLGHVALYIGHGLLVHAPHAGTRVSIARLSSLGDWAGARRLIH